uniref:Putative secreted protein n=1 Tax=Ixodes ricinus TaxID=34613 RepID=A0A6B0V118_IXORI
MTFPVKTFFPRSHLLFRLLFPAKCAGFFDRACITDPFLSLQSYGRVTRAKNTGLSTSADSAVTQPCRAGTCRSTNVCTQASGPSCAVTARGVSATSVTCVVTSAYILANDRLAAPRAVPRLPGGLPSPRTCAAMHSLWRRAPQALNRPLAEFRHRQQPMSRHFWRERAIVVSLSFSLRIVRLLYTFTTLVART